MTQACSPCQFYLGLLCMVCVCKCTCLCIGLCTHSHSVSCHPTLKSVCKILACTLSWHCHQTCFCFLTKEFWPILGCFFLQEAFPESRVKTRHTCSITAFDFSCPSTHAPGMSCFFKSSLLPVLMILTRYIYSFTYIQIESIYLNIDTLIGTVIQGFIDQQPSTYDTKQLLLSWSFPFFSLLGVGKKS